MIVNLNRNFSFEKQNLFFDSEQILINIFFTNDFFSKQQLLEKFLPENEYQRFQKINLCQYRKKCITHRALLRFQLGLLLGQCPASITIKTTQFGKPFIKKSENEIGIKFNVSHSENFVAFAFSKSREVGIDIEEKRALSIFSDIASLVLTKQELRELDVFLPAQQREHFLQLWTKKEAISKLWGLGLNFDFKKIALGFSHSSQENFLEKNHLQLFTISKPSLFYGSIAYAPC
ncbi:MAG: 4'-phosphopantetheinyl transferase superfamily protein [Myxococcales bacterium]|nr:4'-phosphopantetheinyl transferase superfamily protein [Myxococcales bacterium]